MDTVDMHSFGSFYRQLLPSEQVYLTKMVFDQWNVGTNRYKQAKVKDPHLLLCPCCKKDTENSAHVFRCHYNPAREGSFKTLRKQLSTDPHPVLTSIKTGI
jgi:hypothetical protein